MNDTTITLAFRYHQHIFAMKYPTAQALDLLFDASFLDDMLNALITQQGRVPTDPFAPFESGLILFDFDHKQIFSCQDTRIFNEMRLPLDTWARNEHLQRLWQDDRLKSVEITAYSYPIERKDTFKAFQEQIHDLLKEMTVSPISVVFHVSPPVDWNWEDCSTKKEQGETLFLKLLDQGFLFKDRDYDQWEDFFPAHFNARGLEARWEKQKIDDATCSVILQRKSPRL